jgi:hypothetical protein
MGGTLSCAMDALTRYADGQLCRDGFVSTLTFFSRPVLLELALELADRMSDDAAFVRELSVARKRGRNVTANGQVFALVGKGGA